MNPIHSNHITRVRKAATQLIAALDDLRALKAEWDALNLGDALDDGKRDGDAPAYGDFDGQAHLTKAHIAAVFTTLVAIEELMRHGHATNLYRVRS